MTDRPLLQQALEQMYKRAASLDTQEASVQDLQNLANNPMSGEIALEAQEVLFIRNSITALRERLAQPEQEPVATDWERVARVQDAKLRAMCDEPGGFEKLCEVMDRYEHTSPPTSKPWVGLTKEDMYEIGEFKNTHGYVPTGFKRLVAAIEAKLREKNA